MRLLVAEDDPTFAAVLRFTLQHAGFDVLVVKDGQAAWEALENQEFHLLVSDHQMPRMTGAELCRRMREVPRLAELPIILISAKRLELDVEQLCNDYGVRYVFSKPFSPRRLLSAVQAELGLAPHEGDEKTGATRHEAASPEAPFIAATPFCGRKN
jgi:CheY-like chemotaxis protein